MNNITGRVATPITIHLIIINALLFMAHNVFKSRMGIDLQDLMGLHYFEASNHHWWQYFTYMFMHGSFTHLFNNMFSLFMFGRLLEEVWGETRFIIYDLVTGVGAAIIQQLAWS
ncbi:MAG: rhomboid family intramembrane serine protease, partial [Bacteroidales bacterium]|nr:rhomboid family intramembrane serine protease [Bacteroidales bacterium]